MESGLRWLGGKTWAQVTREERFFCAELFFAIRQDVAAFVRFLNQDCHWVKGKRTDAKTHRIRTVVNWDPAYEACFYRDFGQSDLSQKRTFDLALFSNEAVILIEAKAHGGFDGKQLANIEQDRSKIAKLIELPEEAVFLVGLTSSKYTPRCETKCTFDIMTTWSDLASWVDSEYAEQIFTRANEVYQRPPQKK